MVRCTIRERGGHGECRARSWVVVGRLRRTLRFPSNTFRLLVPIVARGYDRRCFGGRSLIRFKNGSLDFNSSSWSESSYCPGPVFLVVTTNLGTNNSLRSTSCITSDTTRSIQLALHTSAFIVLLYSLQHSTTMRWASHGGVYATSKLIVPSP